METMVRMMKSIFNNQTIFVIILTLGTIGSILQTAGGNWDITSHLMNEPETFFTSSHALLYFGIGLLILTTIFSIIYYLKNSLIKKNKVFLIYLKLLVIGSVLCIISGPSDYFWHEAFGVDGLLSPTHFLLVTGMFINSISVTIGLVSISCVRRLEIIRKMVLIFSFSALLLSSMGYVFLFTLPFSNGENFNFNINSDIAAIIATITIPMIFSIIYFTSSKVIGLFGTGSMIATIVIIINISTNFLPTGNILTPHIWWYLPVGLIPVLFADIVFRIYNNSKFNIEKRTLTMLLIGIIIGSNFYFFNFPKIVWIYSEPMNMVTLINSGSGLAISELYYNFLSTLPITSVISIISGSFMGIIGIFISNLIISKINDLKKIEFANNLTNRNINNFLINNRRI